jgi:hypothetical protein
MSLSKRPTYEEVIGRIDDALKREFFLEASWITYSLFEDRCNSMLKKTGGMPPVRPGQFLSINKKLTTLKERASTDILLTSIDNISGIIEEVRVWKDSRNPIMHSMVEMPTTWESVNSDAEALAKDGRELLGRFSSVAMKVRKNYKKQSN